MKHNQQQKAIRSENKALERHHVLMVWEVFIEK